MDRENKVQEFVAQLESNPYDLAPIGHLEDAFNSPQGAEDLIALLASRAIEVSSADAAARLYLEAARIAGTGLKNSELSQELLGHCLEVGEETLVSLEAYLFQLAILDNRQELEQFFAQALEYDADGRFQSRLYQRMGCILESYGDLEQADTAYQWALDFDPENGAARWSRRTLARKENDWVRLASLLIEEVERSSDPVRQSELSVAAGRIYFEKLGADEEALQCFAFALEADPENDEARRLVAQFQEEEPVSVEVEPVEVGEELADEDSLPGEDPIFVNGEAPMTMDLDAEMFVEEEPAAQVPPEMPAASLEEDSLEIEAVNDSEEEFLEARQPEEDGDFGEEDLEESDALEEALVQDVVDDFDGDELTESIDEGVEDESLEESIEDEVAERAEEVDQSIEEVEELEEIEKVEESAEDGDEERQRSWKDRFEELAAAGDGSLSHLVKAARVLSLHGGESEKSLRLWKSAIASGMAREFYAEASYLFRDSSTWATLPGLLAGEDEGLKAKVLLIHLQDKEAAKSTAEGAGDEEVLQYLEDLQEGEANWRKFQRALEKKHEDLGEEEKLLAVFMRMADLASALGDSDKEIDALRRLERQVDSSAVSGRLMALYRESEKWPMYVDLLKKDGEAAVDLEEKADILYEVIRVYRNEMNNDRMAINVYKEILEMNPEDIRAIDELTELYEAMNMSSDLISMLQTKAELVSSRKAKVEIYSEIAKLFIEKFRNQAEAIKAYEQVLEIDNYNKDAIVFLKEMYEKRRDWESLIEIHKREIETFETQEEKIAGRKEVAELASEKLRNPEVATELWLEVREIAPEDSDALDALEKLYEKSRDYEALADVLLIKGPLTDDLEERMKLYQKLGMLFSDRLEDSERAIEAWKAALELAPDDLKARKALERLYIDNRKWQELEDFYAAADAYSDLVRILGTLTGTIKEEEIKIDLLLRSARIWREELEDTPRAERELERALQIDERSQAAAAQLEPIYEEAKNYEKLKDVLEIVLSHLTESEERKAYELKLARLHRDQFGDQVQAFGWLARAFREVPAELDVVSELEEAAKEAGQWSTLVGHYEAALDENLEPEIILELRLLLGRVLSEEVEELDEALEQFQAVLASEEDNLVALEAMESIYRRSERWDELMTVYRHRLELEDSPAARVGILQGMAQIAENEAGDIATAIARHNEALELDKRNEISLRELHRLYQGEGDFADLVDIIRQEIDLIERRARQKSRRKERSAIDWTAVIGSKPAAAEAPGDLESEEEENSLFGDAYGGADEGVEDVLGELGDSGLGEGYGSDPAYVEEGDAEVFAEDAASSADQADALGEESGKEESLDDVDMAARPFYTEREVRDLTTLRFELGVVSMEHLGEVDEGIQAIGMVLSWRPDHQEARQSIEGLLEDRLYSLAVARILEPVFEVHGQWESLVQVLSIQAIATDDEVGKRELYRRIGKVLLEEIGAASRAFDSYGEVLRLQPGDEEGRTELYRISSAIENWDSFVDLYEEVLPTVEEEDLRVDYYFTLAGVNAQYRSHYDEAKKYLEEIFALRPDSMRALDDLEELFIATEQWQSLLDVIDRKLGLLEEEEEIRVLQFRKARVWEEFLADPNRAIQIYQTILDGDESNSDAFANLDRIFTSEGMWNELGSNLQRQLDLREEPQERRALKNQLAKVLEAHLNNADGAVDLYEEVLEEEPDNADANEAMEVLMGEESAPRGRISRILEPLYMDRGDASKLVDALEVQVEVSVDPEERVGFYHRIAVLHEESLGDLASAFRTYARALADDVTNDTTLASLYRLSDETHGFDELVSVFEEQAESQLDPETKRDMLRRAATLYIDPLQELVLATERLHSVLELFPTDLVTVEELEEIYRHTEEWPELVEILVTKAELVEDVDDKKTLYHQAGTLYEDILGQPEEAISIYNRALGVDPADAHGIDRLEVLYTQLESWHDLLDVYRRKFELAQDDEARKDLLYVMGAIYRDHLEQSADAIDTYRQILDIDETEMGALEKLDELFETTEQWHELLEILEQELRLSQYEEDAETFKFRIGRLWEVHLGDCLRAVEVFEEVLQQNGEHRPSIEALEGLVERGENEVDAARVLQPLYQEKGEWEKLVHILRLLITAAHEQERKLDLYKEVAQIVEYQLQDQPEAFATYVEALGVEPGKEETLENLERLARDLNGWEVLVDQIDERLLEISDFEVATELQLRVARIQEEELRNVEAAIERFQRVMEIEPTEKRAILALDRLYQAEGRWIDLAEILKTRIYNTEEPAEALDLRLRLGMLYQLALQDAELAIQTYQEVLLEESDNPVAIENLETMFIEGQEVTRIAEILEPFYLERGDHEKVVEIYLHRLRLLEDPFERFELLMQVARILLDELQDTARALQAYGQALVERPDDEQVLAEIERLAEENQAWEYAAGYYAEALESPHNTDDSSLGLLVRLARVLDHQLQSFEDAEHVYLRALEVEGGHGESLEALDRIYLDQARWADLGAILERRIENTYDEFEVVELSYRLAQVFQNQLSDFDRAVETYERILTIQPDHEESLGHLEQIHMTLQAWQPLYEVLERRVLLTHDPEEQADFYSRMAQIAEEMLSRKEDAVDLWRRVSDVQPENRIALQELRRLYLEDERWDDLVSVLRREVELTPEPEEQLGLYESLGTIYGAYLHDEIQAQDAWRAVLSIDPVHLEALDQLKELTTRQADYQQLAEIIGRLLEHEQVSPERKLALWEELGKVQGEMLMNPDAAIEAWTNVIGLYPEHPDALNELERLYLQESRWEEAAQVLEIKAERADDIEDRIELLRRTADIWESKLFERGEAIRHYKAILELDQTRMMASQALESIFREQGTLEAYQELASLYLDRAQVSEDAFDQVEMLRSAARIFDEQLEAPENALVVMLSAFSPTTIEDLELRQDIERLARQTGLWEEVVARCEEILDSLDDTPEAARLHRQVGKWRAEELQQPDEAVYHLRRSLMIEPDSLEVLELLEKLYRQLAAWPELAQILRSQVDLASDPDRKVEIWRKLGELCEMQMAEFDDAVEAYREILVIEPSDILAMESLERVFETFQRWNELVEILEQKANATYDPDAIVAIRSRVASIWEEELQDISQAIIAHQSVLAADQSHLPSLEALERLYMSTEQWNELVDIYEQQLAMTHEPQEQISIYGRMAAIHEGQFQDLDRAVEAYNSILMVDVENETAVENLERLYREMERWFELVDTLQRHIEIVDHAMQKVALYTELGRLQRDQIQDAHSAIESMQKALDLEPVNPEIWGELAALHEQTSNWDQAVEAYDRLVEQVDDEETRVEVYYRLGQLHETQLHDHARAEDAYLSALRLAPTHPGVLEAVRKLKSILQDWQGLVRVLKAAEEGHRDLDLKAELICEIGKIYEVEIGDEVNALGYYEEALELNPRNPTAARPLIEVYIRERRFERAVPLLEMILQEYAGVAVEADELHRRNLQLGRAYHELAQPDEALAKYRSAYELMPADQDTLKGFGQVLFEQDELEQASKILQTLLMHHEDRLERHELVDVYFRLGAIRNRLNDLRKAGQYFDRALEVEQHHRPSLQARIEVAEAMGKWDEVVSYTRWILETEKDPTVRFAQLSKIGDVLAGKLSDPNQAVLAFEEALQLDPKSMVALRKMLDLYTKTKMWHEAVGILLRIVEQEDNEGRISTYYYTAGVIYREEIGEPMEAVKYFNKALDTNVKMLKAFEAIDRILTQHKAWKELSRAYRAMLHRLKDREDMEEIKVLLWTNLGEVYRTRRGDMETAIEAYEIAVGLNPGDEKTRLILAELYEKVGTNPEGVIAQHRELIKLDQFRVDSYRKLFKSYIQTKEYDRAWCMASALSFLQSASEQEETFFRKYLGSSLQAATNAFHQEMYKKLSHPDQDSLTTFIMSVLGMGLRESYSVGSVKDWGLHKRKDKIEPDEDIFFNRYYRYVAQTVNLLPAPQVYLRGDQAMGMRNANLATNTVIIGGDVRQKNSDREVAFTIAKTLTWMQPQHYIGSVGHPTEFLKALFMALMDLTAPQLGLGARLGEQGAQYKQQIVESIPGPTLMQAQKAMKKFLDKGENPNLSQWLIATEHTAIRMGLLLCGDIHTAASCIKADLNAVGKATVKEKIREMVLFSISEEYFQLREELGLAIGK